MRLSNPYFPTAVRHGFLVMTFGVVFETFFLVIFVPMWFTSKVETTEVNTARKSASQETVTLIFRNEIELGQFTVSSTPVQNLSLGSSRNEASILQFDASVMVRQGKQSMRVQNAFDRYRHRLNATVESVIRNASAEELRDPELRSLRAKIRSNVNRILGGKVVSEVIVSEFRNFRL